MLRLMIESLGYIPFVSKSAVRVARRYRYSRL